MDYTGAADNDIELLCLDVDETQEMKKPSGANPVVRIQVEGKETELDEDSEMHGSSERQVHMSESARVAWDGAAERANRGRDIYWYIWEGEKEAVRGLLRESKDKDRQVKMKDSHGYAPVHYAAKFNRPEIMQILVDGGADVKAKTVSEEYTPLHLAACYLRHACKPCKSAKSAETSVQPEVFDQPDTAKEYDGSFKRTQSDTGTLELRRKKRRRRSSAPAPGLTSCKEIFDFLVTDCKEIDVNAKDQYGFTALHIACQSGNKEAVESLLDHEDVDVTIKDGNGDTPLHEACFHGHNEIAQVLLDKMKENEKPVNTTNNAGLTPFHIACREDHYNIVELLLEACPNLVNEGDNDNATPLHYACRNDSVKIVKLLMSKSNDNICKFLTPKTSDGVTPIHVAAQYGCVKVMEEFLKRECKVINVRDTYHQTPLHYATEYGKTDMMILLLSRGADIEAEDVHSYTPLLTAAEYGQVEGFELLLNKGAMLVDREDPDVMVKSKDRKTVLFLAAEHNHPKIIELTLTNRNEGYQLYKTTDTSFNTCLHIAAQNGHLKCVKVLWNHRDKLGLKLHKKNALLKTAMHLAAENGHNHIITELQHYWEEHVKDIKQHEATDVGRLLKSVDDNGNTPLHLACKHGFMDIAKTLIKMPGANIGARNKVLWTPLDCAAANGHARIIKELVSAKAEIDPTDKLKTTPLHLAAKEGHVTAVETLIKHGANVGLRDQRGFNALDWAIEKGHRDVAEAIITSSKWKLALRNRTKARDKSETTPFRKLIQRMPDVAQLVLKKCTITNAEDRGSTSPDEEDYAVTFSYEFIEDSEDAKEWKAQSKTKSDGEKTSNSHSEKDKKMKHPLRIMVESKRTELLKHPLIYSLIDHKWKYEMVMAYFYLALVCYLLFAILLTTFALKLPSPLSPTCIFSTTQEGAMKISQLPSSAREVVTKILINQNGTVSDSTDGIFSHWQEDLCNLTPNSNESLAVEISEILCGKCPEQSKLLTVLAYVLIVSCSVRVVRKISRIGWKGFYLYKHRSRVYYHHIGNYIDNIDLAICVKIPLLLCTIVFIAVVHGNKCLCPLEWQWQVGIVAVFLAWADVVLYMRKLRLLDTGLYVLMFQSIFKTFLRAMILTITLIVMFAIAFHMTFNHFHSFFERSPFNNMLQSTWKTMTMTTGEMGYEDIFHLSSEGSDSTIPPIPFPKISYILWIIFLILMPILFTNLLVGLAVDDIKGIQEAATLKRLEMRVDLILALDGIAPFRKLRNLIFKQPGNLWRFLPGFGNCQSLHKHKELTIHPNKLSFYSFVPQFLVGENYSSAEHLSLELNPTKTPADQVTQNLMLEISKIQEMLLSMSEGLREVKERVRELSEEKTEEQTTPPTPALGLKIAVTPS